jgi:outer membrane protein assembly factor BamB
VKNQGDTDAVAKFYTKLYVDDVEKGSWNHPTGLTAGKSAQASEDIGTLSAGDHKVKVVTDTTGIIDESDESNNIYSKTLTVKGVKPDLTPFEITWTPSSPSTSDNITVTLQVKNQGDTDAVAKFYTKLYVDDVEKGSWYTDSLTAGESAHASEDIGTLSAGDHKVKVVIDPTGIIDESDESNNIYSKTLTVFTGANIFDTGKPAKSYPSMMGTHEGTIIPSSDITISKLYTYPCTGTGGHTESIKLYENGTLKTSGAWNGYQSDWHNITLAPPVILRAGHTYDYTIVTGSYPQIIHAKSKDVTGGTITCDEFVDTNGKIYTDWIPAIKLLGRDAPTDYATSNWLHFGYDNSYTGYNPVESTISITNVAQLERKWGVGCDDPAYSTITSSPAIYNGTLYTRFKISPSYSKLHAYDARTGQMLWQFSKNNTGRTPQPVVSEDGIIFDMEGSYPTNLYAIDADTGTELWEAPIAFALSFTETALVTVDEENNVVYLVDFGLRGEGKLFALDKQTGEIVWFKNKATDDVSFEGDYVLLNEGKIFAVAEAPKQQYTTNMDHMLCIDASSHDIEIIFDRPEPEGYYDIEHYALCNDKLVVGFDYQYEPVKLLVAYDPDSPTIVWQKEYLEITGKIACNTTKNVIYVPTDPYLYALDVTTGEEVWKYMGYGEIYNPSVANGIVYFLSDTNMYAINEDTGERLFSYPLGKKAHEGAQVAICEGMLYFSGNRGTCDLYALGLPG